MQLDSRTEDYDSAHSCKRQQAKCVMIGEACNGDVKDFHKGTERLGDFSLAEYGPRK